ncbi:MAG: hypothetical protein JNM63_01295 [Spirochaetia bacterium]|nr:hypothetical protein [Spirochaetia bacterium]
MVALTLGAENKDKPVRLLAAVPHAHEPGPTAALVNLVSGIAEGKFLDGTPFPEDLRRASEKILITLLPDTNPQGKVRSEVRAWTGEIDNETFYKIVFGEAADGSRFGRYPEWRISAHHPRRVGIEYEALDGDDYVEPNTSLRSTHTRAIDALFSKYQFTHFLDLHQHEHPEVVLLPAEYDDLSSAERGKLDLWAKAIESEWKTLGIPYMEPSVPYRGEPRQQFFKDYWKGRTPGMLRLTPESRNNRHIHTDEPTSLAHQWHSSWAMVAGTVGHLGRLFQKL